MQKIYLYEERQQQVNFRLNPFFSIISQSYLGLRISWEEFNSDHPKLKSCRWHLSSRVVAALPHGWLHVILKSGFCCEYLWFGVQTSLSSNILESKTLFPACRIPCWNTTCTKIQERPKCTPALVSNPGLHFHQKSCNNALIFGLILMCTAEMFKTLRYPKNRFHGAKNHIRREKSTSTPWDPPTLQRKEELSCLKHSKVRSIQGVPSRKGVEKVPGQSMAKNRKGVFERVALGLSAAIFLKHLEWGTDTL